MTTPALEPVVLEGRHVRLEPLQPGHADALWAVAQDPELWRWTSSVIRSRAELGAYLATAFAERDAGRALPFATLARATGAVVGCTRFAEFAPRHRRVEIGWTWLARAAQRTALNTEAKLLMLRHAFGSLALNRVELKTDVLNEASRRAIARLGACEEGILRRHVITDTGRVRDTVVFSIVADDWPAVEARLVHRLAAGPQPGGSAGRGAARG